MSLEPIGPVDEPAQLLADIDTRLTVTRDGTAAMVGCLVDELSAQLGMQARALKDLTRRPKERIRRRMQYERAGVTHLLDRATNEIVNRLVETDIQARTLGMLSGARAGVAGPDVTGRERSRLPATNVEDAPSAFGPPVLPPGVRPPKAPPLAIPGGATSPTGPPPDSSFGEVGPQLGILPDGGGPVGEAPPDGGFPLEGEENGEQLGAAAECCLVATSEREIDTFLFSGLSDSWRRKWWDYVRIAPPDSYRDVIDYVAQSESAEGGRGGEALRLVTGETRTPFFEPGLLERQ